jgi:transposase
MSKDLVKSLEKLILPVSAGWEITDINIDDKSSEVNVTLSYTDGDYKHAGSVYKIYDYRPSRKWRHLDLWQYKTYIEAQVPRIETKSGIVSIEVPWADDFERITGLFEKK